MGTIASNAVRLRELKDRVDRTFSTMPHGTEHHQACNEFYDNYDSLAFPGGLEVGLEQLARFKPKVIETSIKLLEIDPRFFRSGYIKEKLLRRLKHCELTDDQRLRLESMIVRSMDCGGRREFEGYSRLARRMHSPAFVAAVMTRQLSSNCEVVRRAHAVMHILETNHLL